MKAILVVDIDDSLIEGEDKFAIDGYLMQESDCEGCYEAVGRIKNVVLKPMPKERELKSIEYLEHYRLGMTGAYEREAYSIGWDACLKEIEK